MREIKKHIEQKIFSKVYLLTGDEDYLIMQARTLLKRALVNEGDDMNFKVYEDSKVDMNELYSLASTFPFFAEKRVILLDRTGILKSGKEELVQVFEDAPDTTCIIICEPEADKRTKAYKWIKKNGYIGEFLKKNQTDQVLVRFIATLLGKEKIQIRESDAYELLSMTGNDMYQIKSEVDKIISYMGEEKIVTRQMIKDIVFNEVQDKIFDLVTAIAEGNKEAALSYYEDLVILREPPMHILYLIVRQYRLLTIIKDMKNERRSDADIAKAAGIPPFAVRRYQGQLTHYNLSELENCLRICIEKEQDIKEGKMGDQLALESLIMELLG